MAASISPVMNSSEPQKIDFLAIEQKWQNEWEKAHIFKSVEDSKKPKCYVLEMYVYPSASYLHMGHVRCYSIGDIFARFKRMSGFNVLYPAGYDSFGLPPETAAKKQGIHPHEYTDGAIKKIGEYQRALGNSYDWDRVLSSHDVNYYKWNQFFFLKMLEKGLAYRKKAPVNWCETCQSVLANEEAEGGKCWRCDNPVVQKEMAQWFFKITDYADRLLYDLDKVDWPQKIKTMQRNWIGRSEGVNFKEKVKGMDIEFEVYDSIPQTYVAQTFTVIAPEHPLVKKLVQGTKYEKEVLEFVEKIKKKKATNEFDIEKDLEGVFTGRFVENPFGYGDLQIWVASYVVADYGTGIVNCSAHDERDFAFAKKYGVPLRLAMLPKDSKLAEKVKKFDVCHYKDPNGIIQEPKEFRGMTWTESRGPIIDYIEKTKVGKRTVNYKIRDWLISRQRYWGTPIPVVYCDKCGVVPVGEKDLPVILPDDVDFKFAGNPLATSKSFLNSKCPKCGGAAKRETDTMGGFVDSSWYFLRFCDNKNKTKPFDSKKVKYWMPVDQYIGGAEHAVMHLIYARFFTKVLKDLGFVDFDEPFSKLFNQGIVFKDGAKMSKSKGNVVFQTDISTKYGIDTARIFLMFVSSPDKQMEWTDEGVTGSYRIILKLFRVAEKVKAVGVDRKIENKLLITIRDVTKNIASFDYPKSIIALSGFLDYLDSLEVVPKHAFEELLKLFSPFAPHTSEELWHAIGNKTFVSIENWPKFDEKKIDENLERIGVVVDNLRLDILRVKELAKLEKISKVRVFVAPAWKWDALGVIKNAVGSKPDFGAAMKALMGATEFKKYGSEIPAFVKTALNRMGEWVELEKFDEISVLKEAAPLLAKEFGSIEIIKADDSKEAKAKNAFPAKPALLIE